jgi:hypothetical protein
MITGNKWKKRQRGSSGVKGKLSFERKRHRALKDLAATEDWLDGKLSPLPLSPLPKTEGSASGSLT